MKQSRRLPQKRLPTQSPTEPILCEAEVAEGLEELAASEIRQRFNKSARIEAVIRGAVSFYFTKDLRQLLDLRLAQAIYTVCRFPIPRPKALLGDQNLRIVKNQITNTLRLHSPATFHSFHLSAAGFDSTVMQRIRQEINSFAGLNEETTQGDLVMRVRPSPIHKGTWETLVRISPRPLATRSWRVCNYEGALNATVAHAMVILSKPTTKDRYINLGSGSGSLLIERLLWGGAKLAVGVEHDPAAIHCAKQNIAAAQLNTHICLLQGTIEQLAFAANSFDVLTADLPFGQLVGSHEDNKRLYPQLLKEASHIARQNARFVVITHEIQLMERILREQTAWSINQVLRVTLRGLHPRIYVLHRTP